MDLASWLEAKDYLVGLKPLGTRHPFKKLTINCLQYMLKM